MGLQVGFKSASNYEAFVWVTQYLPEIDQLVEVRPDDSGNVALYIYFIFICVELKF